MAVKGIVMVLLVVLLVFVLMLVVLHCIGADIMPTLPLAFILSKLSMWPIYSDAWSKVFFFEINFP